MMHCAGWRRWLCGAAALTGAVATAAATGAPQLDIERSPAIFRPDEQPQVRYDIRGAAVLTVQDWRGQVLERIRLNPAGAQLALPALPAGYYEIALEQGPATQRRALAILEPAPAPSRTFGVMTHFAQGWSTDIVPLIARAGIGTVRDEQYWQQIEPSPGTYARPARYQQYMTALQDAGIEPLLVLSFANSGYDGGNTPHTPAGRAAFAAYGVELARRHAAQVPAVEVWNEINGSFCSGPCRQDRAGVYAALLADSYAALKAANPRLTIVGGAAVKVPLPWFEALLARGAARHWDAVAVHPYRGDPEGAAQEIGALRQLLHAAGSSAPIWATEFGTGAGKADPAARRETASYLTRMAVVLRATGVQRMYWYLLRDYDRFGGMGLLRTQDDVLGRYAPTPAYAAYATLIRQLDGAQTITREPTDPRTHVYRFARDSDQTHVLWAPDGPVPATVDLADGGVLTNLVGTAQSLPAGPSTLTLDENPQYLRGAVRSISAPRPDILLADARADFSADAAAGPWEYGAYPQPSGARSSAIDAVAADALVQLVPRANAWAHYFGDPRWPGLRVGADTLHPWGTKDAPVWAVRRYRSAEAGRLWVRGSFSRKGRGDGSGALILLEGKTVFEAQLAPGGARRADFDLRLDVPRGARLDFVVTPGPARNITDDAVGLRAWLSRPDGSG